MTDSGKRKTAAVVMPGRCDCGVVPGLGTMTAWAQDARDPVSFRARVGEAGVLFAHYAERRPRGHADAEEVRRPPMTTGPAVGQRPIIAATVPRHRRMARALETESGNR